MSAADKEGWVSVGGGGEYIIVKRIGMEANRQADYQAARGIEIAITLRTIHNYHSYNAVVTSNSG